MESESSVLVLNPKAPCGEQVEAFTGTLGSRIVYVVTFVGAAFVTIVAIFNGSELGQHSQTSLFVVRNAAPSTIATSSAPVIGRRHEHLEGAHQEATGSRLPSSSLASLFEETRQDDSSSRRRTEVREPSIRAKSHIWIGHIAAVAVLCASIMTALNRLRPTPRRENSPLSMAAMTSVNIGTSSSSTVKRDLHVMHARDPGQASSPELLIQQLEDQMMQCAAKLEFEKAASLRDRIKELKKQAETEALPSKPQAVLGPEEDPKPLLPISGADAAVLLMNQAAEKKKKEQPPPAPPPAPRKGLSKITPYDPVTKIMHPMPLITVDRQTSIDEALELLVNNRLGGLPVVDTRTNKLLGVVSDYDLLCVDSFWGQERQDDFFPMPGESYGAFQQLKTVVGKQQKRTVGEVMTVWPSTIHVQTTLQEADRMLLEKKWSRLPVVDDEGVLQGTLSRGDIIKKVLADLGAPVSPEDLTPKAPIHEIKDDVSPEWPVSAIMTERSVAATPQTAIVDGLQLLVKNRIRGLVVVDEITGKLVGVCSDYDMLALDTNHGFTARSPDLFARPDESYAAFSEMKKLISKQSACTIGEVMTPLDQIISINQNLSLADAINVLVEKKVVRLPVVDDHGVCVGVLTRARVIAVLVMMRSRAIRSS